MSYHKFSLRVVFIAFAILSAGSVVWAQNKKKDQGQDPADKQRNIKPELKKAYKDWLEKDVLYIITDEEKKAFKKLATDEERERFIEEFWRRRDPNPGQDVSDRGHLKDEAHAQHDHDDEVEVIIRL